MYNSDKRKNRRYSSIARAKLAGVSFGEALLKDISVTGACIEYTMHLDIEAKSRYTLEIIPEEVSSIRPFLLTVECKWIRQAGYSCDAGFDIIKSPKGKAFENYVDYLDWRSNQN
ncbi:MAG: PilZ domain-containing protein [Treponema sp.]|jgi:hypothetical protein|nr:PilZ domain-containing protein [Treponema sp.]